MTDQLISAIVDRATGRITGRFSSLNEGKRTFGLIGMIYMLHLYSFLRARIESPLYACSATYLLSLGSNWLYWSISLWCLKRLATFSFPYQESFTWLLLYFTPRSALPDEQSVKTQMLTICQRMPPPPIKEEPEEGYIASATTDLAHEWNIIYARALPYPSLIDAMRQ